MSDLREFFGRAEWAAQQSEDEAAARNTEIERLRALVGEHKIALDRHNSEVRGDLVAVLAENKRLRAQVATLTETVEAAQRALNAAPAWHKGIRDAIDVLNKNEVK